MAESTQVKTAGMATLKIYDGTTPTRKEYTVTLEMGDFAYTEPESGSVPVRSPFLIVGETTGQQEPGEVSFTVKFTQFANTTSSEDSLIDVIERTNNWSSAVSTGGAGFQSFMHGLEYTVEGTDFNDQSDHVLDLGKVRLSRAYQAGEQDSVTITGVIYEVGTRTGQGS